MTTYDQWKTCAPEDEPGYWNNHPPEESDEPEPWPDDERAEAEADQ